MYFTAKITLSDGTEDEYQMN